MIHTKNYRGGSMNMFSLIVVWLICVALGAFLAIRKGYRVRYAVLGAAFLGLASPLVVFVSNKDPTKARPSMMRTAFYAMLGSLLAGAMIWGGLIAIQIWQGGLVEGHGYAIHDGDQYGYERADHGLMMVRYLGLDKGQHVFIEAQPSGVGHIYLCANPCQVITYHETLGDQIMSTQKLMNTEGTVAWLMFDDAAHGRLEVAHVQP
jgi:hypothetical protein